MNAAILKEYVCGLFPSVIIYSSIYRSHIKPNATNFELGYWVLYISLCSLVLFFPFLKKSFLAKGMAKFLAVSLSLIVYTCFMVNSGDIKKLNGDYFITVLEASLLAFFLLKIWVLIFLWIFLPGLCFAFFAKKEK